MTVDSEMEKSCPTVICEDIHTVHTKIGSTKKKPDQQNKQPSHPKTKNPPKKEIKQKHQKTPNQNECRSAIRTEIPLIVKQEYFVAIYSCLFCLIPAH